jgi:hypothetical protein
VFRNAAAGLGLMRWEGDAGVTTQRPGGYRPSGTHHGRLGPTPPGTGGIQHAEQLMIGYAEDNGYIVHAMVVSRQLCHDCPSVVRRYRGGRMTIGVVYDPDYVAPPGGRSRPTPRPPGGDPRRRKPPARDTTRRRSGPDPKAPGKGSGKGLRAGKADGDITRRGGGSAGQGDTKVQSPPGAGAKPKFDLGKVSVRLAIGKRLDKLPATRMAVTRAKTTGLAAALNYVLDRINWEVVHKKQMAATVKQIEGAIATTIEKNWDDAVRRTSRASGAHWYFNVHVHSATLTTCWNVDQRSICTTTPFLSLKSVQLEDKPVDRVDVETDRRFFVDVESTSIETLYSISVDDLIRDAREAQELEEQERAYEEYMKDHPWTEARRKQEPEIEGHLEWDPVKGGWKVKRAKGR